MCENPGFSGDSPNFGRLFNWFTHWCRAYERFGKAAYFSELRLDCPTQGDDVEECALFFEGI